MNEDGLFFGFIIASKDKGKQTILNDGL